MVPQHNAPVAAVRERYGPRRSGEVPNVEVGRDAPHAQ